jgi:capsid protein
MGLITTLPWGYKLKQLAAEQPTTVYDAFVNALLREILRPLCVPFNLGSGSSKDSNMASGTLDANIYAGSQKQERLHCEESVCNKVFRLWWYEAILETAYLDDPSLREPSDFLLTVPDLLRKPPKHRWRWDPVTLEHTDPAKVASSLETMRKNGFLTDRDIQEGRFNRRLEDWQEEIQRDQEFRKKIGLPVSPDGTAADGGGGLDGDSDSAGGEA